MPSQREEENQEKIYNFIKSRTSMPCFLRNIRLFAKANKIKPKEMGWALQQLKRQGYIKTTKRGEFHTIKKG